MPQILQWLYRYLVLFLHRIINIIQYYADKNRSNFGIFAVSDIEVIDDANRNEDKYAKRSSRTLDCYGYDDEMSSQFHKELAIMFDDPFERAEEERLTLQTLTSRQKHCFLGW